MLRRTSKKVKEAVDKMRLPAVVRLSRSFWGDARNGTGEAKLELVLRQLAALTALSNGSFAWVTGDRALQRVYMVSRRNAHSWYMQGDPALQRVYICPDPLF
jgi:hypothetical protein